MKQTLVLIVFLALLASHILNSCATDTPIEPKKKIEFIVPKGWPQPKYQFENNPLTEEGFELGRKLFFDPRLSRDNSISCGSCHQPFAAFAQIGHNFSHGVDNKIGSRNSPPLFNLNWHLGFFWDGGVNHIESQPINPIMNPVEMDESMGNILKKLQHNTDYKERFKKAFGDEEITTQRIFKSLAQFMGMLVSNNSKYDFYVRGESGGSLNQEELRGLNTFQTKCSPCHKEPLFSDFSYRNNGLPPITTSLDSGRAHITKNPEDKQKFKVPALRNLKYTSPYMHDGRFNTLEQVLEHYATGIQHSSTLDPLLVGGISLTVQERNDLLHFLNTLNDEVFVSEPRFKEVK